MSALTEPVSQRPETWSPRNPPHASRDTQHAPETEAAESCWVKHLPSDVSADAAAPTQDTWEQEADLRDAGETGVPVVDRGKAGKIMEAPGSSKVTATWWVASRTPQGARGQVLCLRKVSALCYLSPKQGFYKEPVGFCKILLDSKLKFPRESEYHLTCLPHPNTFSKESASVAPGTLGLQL